MVFAAVKEAVKIVGENNIDQINIVEKQDGLNQVVLPDLHKLDGDYRYVHYCANEP